MYCKQQNYYTMNIGVGFLVVTAFRQYYNKINEKLDRAKNKAD